MVKYGKKDIDELEYKIRQCCSDDVRANWLWFCAQVYGDEKTISICKYIYLYSLEDREFTIDCLDTIIARDTILNLKVDNLFDRYRLYIINSYFKVQTPDSNYDEIWGISRYVLPDTITRQIIEEVAREVRSRVKS